MKNRQRDLRVYLGKGGLGKSYLAQYQAEQRKRVIIFDPNGEPEKAKGAVVVATKLDLVRACSVKGSFRVCWRGFIRYGKDAFDYANEVAIAAGNVTVIWDEVDRFMSTSQLPPHADKIINAGRHWNVAAIACARRAQRVHRDLTGNASMICVFRSDEPSMLKYVKDYIGAEWVDQVRALPPRQCVVWTETDTKIKKNQFL